MRTVHQIPSFVEFAFGPAFAAGPGPGPAPDPSPEWRPTAPEGYAPVPFEGAFWLGFNLGLDREDAAAPDHFSRHEARAFDAGWAAGFREWERRLDEMFADAVADGRVTDLDVHPRGVC